MEYSIVVEKENPLFSRKEIVMDIESQGVPTVVSVQEEVAKKYGVDKGVVRVREVRGKYGVQVFRALVDVYSSIEEFNRIVNKTKQEIQAEKKAIEEAKKAAEEAKKAEEDAKKAEEEAKAAPASEEASSTEAESKEKTE